MSNKNKDDNLTVDPDLTAKSAAEIVELELTRDDIDLISEVLISQDAYDINDLIEGAIAPADEKSSLFVPQGDIAALDQTGEHAEPHFISVAKLDMLSNNSFSVFFDGDDINVPGMDII